MTAEQKNELDAQVAGTDFDAEWDALDEAAEVHEQAVFEEIAAARVTKAKMDATALKRQQAKEEHEKKEADKAEAAAKMVAPDEELTEEEVLKRRATVAAKDGVQLRNTMRMAIFFAALGGVEIVVGFMRSNMMVTAVGAILLVFCLVFIAKLRPRHKAAVEHFNILHAELEEYYVKNPKTEDKAEEGDGEVEKAE